MKLKEIYKNITHKYRRRKILKKIISDVYYHKHWPEQRERIEELFVQWFESDNEQELKNELLSELIDKEIVSTNDFDQKEYLLSKLRQQLGFKDLENEPKLVNYRLRVVSVSIASIAVISIGIATYYLTTKSEKVPMIILAQVENPMTVTVGENNISESKSVNLIDGTAIKLRTGSRLTYPQTINGSERVVELQGEAFLSVAKNEAKPFVVKTRDVVVRVLGTEFEVRAYPESDITIVTLQSGSVQITDTENNIFLLSPNEQLIYDRKSQQGTVRTVKDHQIAETTKWTRSDFDFQGKTLREIIQLAGEYYAKEIEIVGTIPELDSVISGTLPSQYTAEQFMEQITILEPKIKCQVLNTKIIISIK